MYGLIKPIDQSKNWAYAFIVKFRTPENAKFCTLDILVNVLNIELSQPCEFELYESLDNFLEAMDGYSTVVFDRSVDAFVLERRMEHVQFHINDYSNNTSCSSDSDEQED